MADCKATTKAGERCKNEATVGKYCALHAKAHADEVEAEARDKAGREIAEGSQFLVPRQDHTGSTVLDGTVTSELGKGGNPPPDAPDATNVPDPEPNPLDAPPNPPRTGVPVPTGQPGENDTDPYRRESEAGENAPDLDDGGAAFAAFRQEQDQDAAKATIYEEQEYRGRPSPSAAADPEAPTRQATPKYGLPPAPPRNPDGSIDARPGMVEGNTAGQSDSPEPEQQEVIFNSGDYKSLQQFLPDGSTVVFAGGFYRTNNPEVIRMLRDRAEDSSRGAALYFEDDPVEVYRCSYCQYSTGKGLEQLRKHMRERHQGLPQLA